MPFAFTHSSSLGKLKARHATRRTALPRTFIRTRLVTVLAATLTAALTPHAALAQGTGNATGLIVPAYWGGDGAEWAQLTAAADDVPIIAIANEANGPGTEFNPDLNASINTLRAAGGDVIGYVYTQYGTRNAAVVKQDIDRWAADYDLDGIFFDEMSNDTADLPYYTDLYDYTKQVNTGWRVVGNPGFNTGQVYLAAADTLVVIETGTDYETYEASLWNANHGADRFAHLVHSRADGADMRSVIDAAFADNAGWVYVTDDVMSNPWDTLPAFWDDEVAYLAALNVPEPTSLATIALPLAMGACATSSRRRRGTPTTPPSPSGARP